MITTELHTWKTFQEWSFEGYWIKKGSKAVWFDNVAMFNETQVSKRFANHNSPVWEGTLDADINDGSDGPGDDWWDPMDWGCQ